MKSELAIRRTPSLADIPRVREIMKSSGFFDKVFDEYDCAEEELRGAIDGSGEIFIFAELDGRVVGFASYEREACCESLYYLDWIAVDNTVRGHGIGRRLVEAILADVAERGATKLLLQTSGREQYLPTRKFYEKLGFVKEAEISDYYSPGESSVFYGRRVKALP